MAKAPKDTNQEAYVNWTITALDVKPEADKFKNFVVTAHWNLTATSGDLSASVYGTCSFAINPNKKDYRPYESLTQDEVIGWVHASMGDEQVAAYEANAVQQLDDLINPPVTHPALPWS